MSQEEKPEEENGGLSNEPLPGSGGGQQPPETPATPAGGPPAAPEPGAGATPAPPPPPPPAPAAAAPAADNPLVAPAGPGQPGLAIAAFVCGLISILTSWCCIGVPLGVAAIVCGFVAKGEVEKRGAPSWMWITGVVLGAISLLLFLILLIVGVANTDWNVSTSTS